MGENSGSSETHVAGSVFSQRDGPVHFRSALWGYTRCLEVDGTRVPASPRDPPAPAGGSLGAAARVKWQLLAQAQEPPEGPEGVAWGQPLCPPCWPRHGWTARSLSRGHSPGTRASSRAAGLCAGPSAAAVAEPSPRSGVRVPERARPRIPTRLSILRAWGPGFLPSKVGSYLLGRVRAGGGTHMQYEVLIPVPSASAGSQPKEEFPEVGTPHLQYCCPGQGTAWALRIPST